MEHIISKIQYYIMHINFMTMISYAISLLSFFKKRIIIIKLQMVYVCHLRQVSGFLRVHFNLYPKTVSHAFNYM